MTECAVLQQRLDDHITNDNRRFEGMEQNLDVICGDIKAIKENHLAHIQSDISRINIKIAKDSIIVRLFWIVIGAGLGVGITLLIKALLN